MAFVSRKFRNMVFAHKVGKNMKRPSASVANIKDAETAPTDKPLTKNQRKMRNRRKARSIARAENKKPAAPARIPLTPIKEEESPDGTATRELKAVSITITAGANDFIEWVDDTRSSFYPLPALTEVFSGVLDYVSRFGNNTVIKEIYEVREDGSDSSAANAVYEIIDFESINATADPSTVLLLAAADGILSENPAEDTLTMNNFVRFAIGPRFVTLTLLNGERPTIYPNTIKEYESLLFADALMAWRFNAAEKEAENIAQQEAEDAAFIEQEERHRERRRLELDLLTCMYAQTGKESYKAVCTKVTFNDDGGLVVSEENYPVLGGTRSNSAAADVEESRTTFPKRVVGRTYWGVPGLVTVNTKRNMLRSEKRRIARLQKEAEAAVTWADRLFKNQSSSTSSSEGTVADTVDSSITSPLKEDEMKTPVRPVRSNSAIQALR